MERTNLRCDEIGGSSLGQRDEKSLLQTGLAAEPQITLLQSTEDNFATGRASSHGRMLPNFVQDGAFRVSAPEPWRVQNSVMKYAANLRQEN
jgi:hypothetical protein